MAKDKLQPRSVKRQRMITDTVVHIFLAVMCIVWLLPLFYIVAHSFRAEKGQFVSGFLPQSYTFDNYIALFKEANVINFPRMFLNTFGLAICTCAGLFW